MRIWMEVVRSPHAPTIRELRNARGWSQVTLARKLQVTELCVKHWEAGRRRPWQSQLDALAGLFGLPASEIGLLDPQKQVYCLLPASLVSADVPLRARGGQICRVSLSA